MNFPFKNERGISNKPAGVDLYHVPVSIFSQDENSKERRCGMLSFCQNIDGVWIGYTVAHLFTDTWKAGRGYDPDDKVVGKSCYQFTWATSTKADITTDHSLMKDVRKIGVVVKGLGHMVAIKLDPEFVNTPMFQNHGFWA